MKTVLIIFFLAIICFGCSKKDHEPQALPGEYYIKFKADGKWHMIDQSVDILAWREEQPNSEGTYEFGIIRYSIPPSYPVGTTWNPAPALVFQIVVSDSLKIDAGKTYASESVDSIYHPYYASLNYSENVGTENQIQYAFSYNTKIGITSITDTNIAGTFSGLVKERGAPGRMRKITDGSFLAAYRR